MNPLGQWQNFYVIVGSAAGALTGLQFVVVALLSDVPLGDDSQAISAFSTPSIIHFCVVLLLAAIIVMPWHTLTPLAIIWCITGICGAIYSVFVGRAFHTQTAYKPVLEDWIYRVILPLIGYLALATAAIVARFAPRGAMFQVAALSLLLLFIGIHHAWDNATYIVRMQRSKVKSQKH